MEADRASGSACTVALCKPLMEAGDAARIPAGRTGTGDEMEQAMIFLVGNDFTTGQIIAVNGGSLLSGSTLLTRVSQTLETGRYCSSSPLRSGASLLAPKNTKRFRSPQKVHQKPSPHLPTNEKRVA
jgi:hypothetical protein